MLVSDAATYPWGIAELNADRPYLVDAVHNRTYSYGFFIERARSLADDLEERGLEIGARLAILLPNCPEFAALYFACCALGAVAVPISVSLHPSEIRLLLGRCEARLVACTRETAALLTTDGETALAAFEIQPWGLDANGAWFLADRHAREPQAVRVTDKHAALSMTFTSGTTGSPKGIIHSSASIFGAAAAFAGAIGYDCHTRLQHLFPMAYMAGFLNSLICPFVAGGSVVVGRGFAPESALCFWDEPVQFGVNTLWTSPTMLAALLRVDRQKEGPAYARSALRVVSVGTAPYSPALRESFEDRYGIATYESYGLSETLFVSTTGPQSAAVGVGQLLPGVEVECLPCLAGGAATEVAINSDFLMLGQFDSSDGTVSAPPSAWFLSGDLGHLDTYRNLHIDGRLKDLIIRGGTNVSPRAVENFLELDDGVEAAAVIGVPHAFYGEEVVAAVRLRPGFVSADVCARLLVACKAGLARHAVPSRFLVVEEFPCSSNGKVQKAKLRELAVLHQ